MIQKIVACCTTIPSRMHYLETPIKSMLYQTLPIDKFYIFIPKFSKKENKNYPEIVFDKKLKKEDNIFIDCDSDKVCVYTAKEDYGPITKLYPITFISKVEMGFNEDDEVLIINVDDDRDYMPDTVESLVKAYNANNKSCAVGITGWIYGSGFNKWVKVSSPKKETIVDWLEASYGVLYPYQLLLDIGKSFEKFELCPEARYCDDIWICYWLKKFNKEHPYVYAVNLLSHNPINDTYEELQPSTEAKYINALHYDATEKTKEVSGLWGLFNTGKRYYNVVSKLSELDKDFINAKDLETTFSERIVSPYQFTWWLIICYGFLILVFISIITFFIIAAFRSKRIHQTRVV